MNTLDFSILNWIAAHLHCTFLDKVMPVISSLGDNGLIWIALAVVLLLLPKTRKLGLAVSAALLLDLVFCNLILKPLVARIRPFDVNTAVTLLIQAPWDYSFPSGHTMASFAVVGALWSCRSKLWIPAALLGLLLGFSRLYLYVHYPSDVLGGMVLGLLCGVAGAVLARFGLRAWGNRHLK